MSCVKPHCEGNVVARGLCRLHYDRAWRARRRKPCPGGCGRSILEASAYCRYCANRGERGPTYRADLDAAFWREVQKGDLHECWLWTGNTNQGGYGRFWLRDRAALAHRYAYRFTNGAIPRGHVLHHTCENPACVNPAHLQPLTRAQHVEVHTRGEARC